MKVIKPQYIGLLTAILMMAASLAGFYGLKLPVESNFQWLVYGILATGIIYCVLQYHQRHAGKPGFKGYFAEGFKMFVVVTLVMAVYTYFFFSANTAFRDAKIAENTQLILAEGNHLPNEVEENERQLRKLFMPIMVSSAVFRYLIAGALVTAVAGLILNGKNREN